MAFKNTLALVLDWEGVYDNNPRDPGGETVFGITRVYEPAWAGWAIVDAMFIPGDRKGSITHKAWAEVNLPKNPALLKEVEAYYRGIFDKLMLDYCPSDKLDGCIMGGYVNQGPKVLKWLQEAMNELGECVEVDGLVGVGTMTALNGILQNPMGETALLHGLMLKRVRKYSTSKPEFVAGLFNRVFAGA